VRSWPASVIATCIAAASALAGDGHALAATCAPPPGAESRVGEIDGRVRLRWIDQRMDHEAHRGRVWAGAWAIGIGAGGVASLIAVPFVAPSDRIDWYAGAVTAAIGVVPFLLSPLTVTREAPKLRAAIESTTQADDAAVCTLLVDAERKLASSAANEHWQQGWWSHAGNLVFNAGVTLFLGLGYGHWASGIINGASGVVVGEAIIFTQPRRLVDDLAAYNRGDLGLSSQGSAAPHPLGLGYAATF
jgi:hypothetical protein